MGAFRLNILILLSLWMAGTALHAQDTTLSNLQTRLIPRVPDTICTDSLLYPPSILFLTPGGDTLRDVAFDISGNCIFLKSLPQVPLRLVYRVLPLDRKRHYQWYSDRPAHTIPQDDIALVLPREEGPGLLPARRQLDYRGSFTRGLSIGNAQSPVLHSGFNLQLSGNLARDLRVQAAITDENIPLQPEGNTQNLNEFDKIYIRLIKGASTLTAGDYELQSEASYFLQYVKKLQGLTVQSSINLPDSNQMSVRGAIAIPKGRFARNHIRAIEGNQGPYSLRGNHGERFLIIQAASERVYLDGHLLRRGLDDDYVIDYNRGTITFTPNHLITKDSRIIVEFEYADRRFQSKFAAADASWQHRRWQLGLHVASTGDSKFTAGARELSPDIKQALANAGDQWDQVFVPGIDTADAKDPAAITYELIDTLGYHQVLRYSTDKTKPLFTAHFSEVGLHKGDYIIARAAANGRVYEWVAPVNGIPQGRYAPVIPLVAPQSHRMAALTAQGHIGKHLQFQSELALSQKDYNLFSSLQDDDNIGSAFRLLLTDRRQLGKDAQLETQGSYEFTDRRFRPLNPFRTVEFAREWNLDTLTSSVPAHLPTLSVTLARPGLGHLQWHYDAYFLDTIYQGQRHRVTGRLDYRRLHWQGRISRLQSASTLERTTFWRPYSDISFDLSSRTDSTAPRIGFIFDQEDNRRRQGDSLRNLSHKYDYYRAYLRLPLPAHWHTVLSLAKRDDFAPDTTGRFRLATEALDWSIRGQHRHSKHFKLNWQLTHRQLAVVRPQLSRQQPGSTFLGKVDLQFRLRTWLTTVTTYELSSGQTPKLEYNYLQVDPGKGQYTWIDRNQDSIPQLDEFEVAPFPDQADYIRIAVSTNEYLPTHGVLLNQSFRIDPARIQLTKARWLRRLSLLSHWRISHKRQADAAHTAWNPFATPDAEDLLTSQVSIRHNFYINKGRPEWEYQLGQSTNRRRTVLTSGLQALAEEKWFSKLRIRLRRQINLNLEAETGRETSEAETFLERNYTIDAEGVKTSLSFFRRGLLRHSFGAGLSGKRARDNRPERLRARMLNYELTWTPKNRRRADAMGAVRIRADFSLVNISFDGAPDSAIGFSILKGLRPGRNLLWNVSLDKPLTKTVVLSLLYSGRQTGTGARVIHTGSVQARAIF